LARLLLGASAALVLVTPAPAGPPVVNEILYWDDYDNGDPLREHEWIEIYNPGPDDVGLAGWLLSNRDGPVSPAAYDLPPLIMPPDSYLVIHYADGVNDDDISDGCAQFYTGDPVNINRFDNLMDDVVIYDDTFTVVDYLAWNYGDSGYVPGIAHNDAVAVGVWQDGLFLNTQRVALHTTDRFRCVREGESIGRDKDSSDTNGLADWDTLGGRDAIDYTPCVQNLTPVFVGPDPDNPGGEPPVQKEWTVMVYMDGDNDLERFAWLDLKEMEAAGGSDDNVNVVVQVDSFRVMQLGYVDEFGVLHAVPNTRGGCFRFDVGPEEVHPQMVSAHHVGDNELLVGSPDHGNDPDMGAPGTLSDFITWAKTYYPANRYALILWNHGGGWKGVCWDDSSVINGHADGLYMNELATALAGESFDLVGFDACLMAMIEVAWQVQPYSAYFVGSQEVEPADGWPYDQWIPGLKANPAWTGSELGTRIVSDYDAFYAAVGFADRTHSLIDQSVLSNLVNTTSFFAGDLEVGCDDFKLHGDPLDNVEHRIAVDRDDTEKFYDTNYIDLKHFADLIWADGIIPNCYKFWVPSVVADLQAAVVVNRRGPGHPNANGLSVYFPKQRTIDDPLGYAVDGADPYDYPWPCRVTDGGSQRTMYAPNVDCLPFSGRDVETNAPLAAPQEWPLVWTPAFRFRPSSFHWWMIPTAVIRWM